MPSLPETADAETAEALATRLDTLAADLRAGRARADIIRALRALAARLGDGDAA